MLREYNKKYENKNKWKINKIEKIHIVFNTHRQRVPKFLRRFNRFSIFQFLFICCLCCCTYCRCCPSLMAVEAVVSNFKQLCVITCEPNKYIANSTFSLTLTYTYIHIPTQTHIHINAIHVLSLKCCYLVFLFLAFWLLAKSDTERLAV